MPEWYGVSSLNPDQLIPPQSQWILQWQRIERWYSRVQEVQRKSLEQELSLYDQDIVIAFVQNAWHLKDWLLASQTEKENEINEFFHASFEMKACRDICNGFKHKKIGDPSIEANFNFYREYDHFETEKGKKIKYWIAFEEGGEIRKLDFFNFADDVYKKITDFLDHNDITAAIT
jgi:hypothetical protein